LPFTDPDGLNINLIVSKNIDERVPWETKEIKKENSTKGFHSVTLTLKSIEATAKILTDIFGYSLQSQEGNRYRFATDAVPAASIVDLVETPDGKHGYTAGGTNHHVAFRVANEAIQMNFHDKLASMGLHVTAKIDREYFFSVYFREPGGVLFEIATDNPGFTVDEPLAELGTHLKLPPQYEPSRAEIEKVLPVLK
jgi:glyoxalase family protein